jgi:DNA end-binding protein Ku
MRSMHTARLGFGLVSVNVKMYTATETHDAKFHLHHAGCLGSIRQKRVCEQCGAVVEYGDVVKGIQHGDKLVIVTDDDFASLDEEQGGEIEVLQFVDRADVDPIMFERTYYLDTDNGKSKSAKPTNNDKTYALFRQALSESDKVGIVRFAMRSKTHMGVVRVYGDNVLAIHTLMWSDEVRATDELKIGGKKVELSEKEVKMAHALIDSMAGEWKPTEYEDIYQQRVAEMIDAKADGAEFTTDKPDVDDDGGDVSDLLAKLEASIAAKKTAA